VGNEEVFAADMRECAESLNYFSGSKVWERKHDLTDAVALEIINSKVRPIVKAHPSCGLQGPLDQSLLTLSLG